MSKVVFLLALSITFNLAWAADEIDLDAKQIEMFIRSYPGFFLTRREEQKTFVKKLMADDYEKQYKLIEMAFKNILKMFEVEREYVTNMNHVENQLPNVAVEFQKVVTVLENVCIMGEIIIHIPGVSYKVLDSHSHWRDLLEWAGEIVNKYQYVLDEPTKKMLKLLDLELNPEKRPDDYENPYAEQKEVSEEPVNKKKEKKKPKRGPAMRGGEL